MTIIVTDTGFKKTDDYSAALYTPLRDILTLSTDNASNRPPPAAANPTAASVGVVITCEDTLPMMNDDIIKYLLQKVDIIKIDFTSYANGRGFTLARQLRAMGYQNHLRAHGYVLADQYAMARRSGFDDVEIDAALAKRQPQDHWLARANWQDHNYQTRLAAPA